MAAKSLSEVSRYTVTAFSVGAAVSFALHLFLPRLVVETWVQVFRLNIDVGRVICGSNFECLVGSFAFPVAILFSGDGGAAPLFTCLAFIGFGALVMFASVQLDFFRIEDAAELREPIEWAAKKLGLLTLGIVGLTLVPGVSDLGQPASGILMILLLPLVLVGLLAVPFFSFGSIAFLFGGVLCLPRAFVFWRTQSRLRKTYEAGVQGSEFDARSVVQGLDEQSTSDAHARALRKDIEATNADIEPRLKKLREENERLTAAIEHDTKRKEAAAQLARNMAEMEDLKVKNEELRRFLREGN